MLALVLCQFGQAEQSVEVGGYTVHYSVVPSTFLQPSVAARHNIVRANNRAVITIAARHERSMKPPSQISGSFTNLLSQKIALEFKQIVEGDARYFIAAFLYTSEEPLTFRIQLHLADGPKSVTFKQAVYAL